MTIHQPLVLGPQFANLADDTEEWVLGSSAHQSTIVVLNDGLDACGHGRGLPWFVGNQMRMIVRRAGQRSVSLSPDILVHLTLGSGSRESILVVTDGPPALVIEIASPTTAIGRDLDEGSSSAKLAAYAALAIPEYLVFDPQGSSSRRSSGRAGSVRAATSRGSRRPMVDGIARSASRFCPKAPSYAFMIRTTTSSQPVPNCASTRAASEITWKHKIGILPSATGGLPPLKQNCDAFAASDRASSSGEGRYCGDRARDEGRSSPTVYLTPHRRTRDELRSHPGAGPLARSRPRLRPGDHPPAGRRARPRAAVSL